MPSNFSPTGSDLRSTNLPAALFEIARLLDAAENERNGANPGIAPKQNITTAIDFGTRTIAINASLPVQFAKGAAGVTMVEAVNYLGTPYGAFAPGGDTVAITIPGAFLEIAQMVSSAEKDVQPAEDQPNNVQVSIDMEAGTATVTATLPCDTDASLTGEVIISAVDYF